MYLLVFKNDTNVSFFYAINRTKFFQNNERKKIKQNETANTKRVKKTKTPPG